MINEHLLAKLEEQNKKDPVQNVLKKALFKNKLFDISRVMDVESEHKYRFSLELKTLPITNQKQSGRCWIFAGLNFLREKLAKDLNLAEFEFSQNYVAFYDKLEKINFFLYTIDDFLQSKTDDRTLMHLLDQGIQDGGQWQMFANVVNKYGLVPKDAMVETANSSATGQINFLINLKLRKFACDARQLAKNNQTNRIQALRETTIKELYNLLVAAFGMPPKKINFEYLDKDGNYHLEENLTPQKFYAQYVGLDLNDYVSVVNAPTTDKPMYNTFTIEYLNNMVDGTEVKHLNLPISELKQLVIKQLQDGETVWFGSDVSFDGDRTDGIWDDRQFDFESTFGLNLQIEKADKLDYRIAQMNHAMTLTGVNLVDKKANKWKIQNSWGDTIGNKGYFMCSDSWFDKYVFQAVINKKHLTPKQVEGWEKKPKKLKIWDPMGSLAD